MVLEGGTPQEPLLDVCGVPLDVPFVYGPVEFVPEVVPFVYVPVEFVPEVVPFVNGPDPEDPEEPDDPEDPEDPLEPDEPDEPEDPLEPEEPDDPFDPLLPEPPTGKLFEGGGGGVYVPIPPRQQTPLPNPLKENLPHSTSKSVTQSANSSSTALASTHVHPPGPKSSVSTAQKIRVSLAEPQPAWKVTSTRCSRDFQADSAKA
jgi:hypothetical protein